MAVLPRIRRLLGNLAPPTSAASVQLTRRVAAVTQKRLRRARRRLAAPPLSNLLPRSAVLLTAAQGLLRGVDPADRLRLLHGPDLRGWLSEIEVWSEIFMVAEAARRATGGPAARHAVRLFDRISRTEHLVTLIPTGRLDSGFPARAARLALDRLRRAIDDLSALLLGARLAFLGGRGSFEGRLVVRESAEQGRPAGRVDLGTFHSPAGPLALAWGRRADGTEGGLLRVRLQDGVLAVRGTGGAEALFPQPASSARFRWLVSGEDRPLAASHAGTNLDLVRRRCIPGTPILLAPGLRSSPRRLRVGRDLPGVETRLTNALRLVRLAWPEAHEEIVRRTAMVVPVREAGLVSYSLAARPGVSFINVHGKTIVELADDLLHETAHHLLHDVQETADLLAPGPETDEVQAFESPWRGTRRPLHGLLHGTYTFLFRAELFARLIRARGRHRGAVGPLLGRGGAVFLSRELRRELSMIGHALRDLDRASRSRLITPAGGVLVRALRAWHSRLRRSKG